MFNFKSSEPISEIRNLYGILTNNALKKGKCIHSN